MRAATALFSRCSERDRGGRFIVPGSARSVPSAIASSWSPVTMMIRIPATTITNDIKMTPSSGSASRKSALPAPSSNSSIGSCTTSHACCSRLRFFAVGNALLGPSTAGAQPPPATSSPARSRPQKQHRTPAPPSLGASPAIEEDTSDMPICVAQAPTTPGTSAMPPARNPYRLLARDAASGRNRVFISTAKSTPPLTSLQQRPRPDPLRPGALR